MQVCVDFDGTIVDHQYPIIGDPNPGAIEWLGQWIDSGADIILFTMRSGDTLDEAVDYILSNNIQLHGINVNPTQHLWTDSP